MNLCGKKSTECKYEDWKALIQKNLASDDLAQKICGKYAVEDDPVDDPVDDSAQMFSFKMPELPK